MNPELSQAKIDLFTIDDFITTIEKEASSLKEKYHKRLERIKSTNSDIKEYLRSIGVIKGTTNQIDIGMIIGFIRLGVPQEKVGTLKESVAVMNYDRPTSPLPAFNKHILITTDSRIYDMLVARNGHTATIIIKCDDTGKIVESKSYTKMKQSSDTVFLHPRSTLNLNFRSNNFSFDSIEMLQKTLYLDFCLDTNLREFGSTFRDLSPNNRHNGDPIASESDGYYPVSVTSQNIVSFDKEFIRKSLRRIGRNKKLECIAAVLRDNSYEVESSTPHDVKRAEADVSERFIRSRPNTFKIETDVLTGNQCVDRIITTLAINGTGSSTNYTTIRNLYKIAEANKRYYHGDRNILVEDMNHIQRSIYGMVKRVNSSHDMNLQYHQVFGAINVLPYRVSILKASTGLGKTRTLIAAFLAKRAKRMLFVTEPGNILELEREFKEELNMGDVTKIIRKESDLRCLNKFNLVGYSTLTKVLKESQLKDMPTPVTEMEFNVGTSTTNTIRLTNGLEYWGVYRTAENPTMHAIGYTNTSFAKKVCKGKGDPSEVFSIVTGFQSMSDMTNSDIEHTMKHIIDHIDQDSIRKTIAWLRGKLVSPAKAKPVEMRTWYHMTKDLNHSDGTTDINTGSHGEIQIKITPQILRPIIAIIETVKIIPNILEIVDDQYPRFYTEYEEELKVFISKAKEVAKNMKECLLKMDNRNNITLSPPLTKLVVDTFEDMLLIHINSALLESASKVPSMREWITGTKRLMPNTRAPVELRDIIWALGLNMLIAGGLKSFVAVVKILGLTLNRYTTEIERMKQRAKYRTKMFSSLLSDKFNMVVYDECIPASGLIATDHGIMTIGHIVKKRKKVRVLSRNIRSGQWEFRNILRYIDNPLHHHMVILHLDNGLSLTCTSNHKIWTLESGYAPAETTSGKKVCVVRKGVLVQELRRKKQQKEKVPLNQLCRKVENKSAYNQGQDKEECVRQPGVQEKVISSNEGTNEPPRDESCSHRKNKEAATRPQFQGKGNRRNQEMVEGEPNVPTPRGERTANYPTASSTPTNRLSDGVLDKDTTSKRDIQLPAQELQGRPSSTKLEDSNRGRRKLTQDEEVEIPRQEKNGDISYVRVVSIEVLERRDIGKPRRNSKKDKRVYNLEVEGNHNYVVDNILVSNCSNLKNLNAVRAVAISQIKAKNYVFMSATPIANELSEIISYLVGGYGPRSLKHMVDLEYRSYNNFRHPLRAGRKRYNISVARGGNTFEIDIYGSRSDASRKGFPIARLSNLVDRNMTRISRENTRVVQHAAWHFDVKEYRVYSIPTEAHMQLYAAQMEIIYEASQTGKYEDSREALRVLTNLIKISEIPHLISEDFVDKLTNKQNDIVELAKRELGKGRSVIVFTQFIDMVEILSKEIANRVTQNVYMLPAKLTPDQRYKLIDTFRKETNACIAGTISKLGKGFNLPNADVIIMSDIPWSALLYDQSIGRILRPEQKGKPEIFLVMNKYMIDMYKFDTIMSKLNMVKKYVDKDSSISEKDTHKVDYKQFLLDMLQKSIKDGILSTDFTTNHNETQGI